MKNLTGIDRQQIIIWELNKLPNGYICKDEAIAQLVVVDLESQEIAKRIGVKSQVYLE